MVKRYAWWAATSPGLHAASAVGVSALGRWAHRPRSASNLLSVLYSSPPPAPACWAEQISITSWLWPHVDLLTVLKPTPAKPYILTPTNLRHPPDQSLLPSVHPSVLLEASPTARIALPIVPWSQRPSRYPFYVACKSPVTYTVIIVNYNWIFYSLKSSIFQVVN